MEAFLDVIMDNDATFTKPIHGTIPQNLIEKITRIKIYGSEFWRKHCFGLTAELLVDKGALLKYYGGFSSETTRPCPFICLVLKMLQVRLDFEVIKLLILNPHFKYLTILGMFYLRLTGSAYEIYSTLEPFYVDYRKVVYLEKTKWNLLTIDTVVHELLTRETFCNIVLPRLPARKLLVEQGLLKPKSFDVFEDVKKSIELAPENYDSKPILADRKHETILENPLKPKKKKRKLRIKGIRKIKQKVKPQKDETEKPPEEFSVEYWNEQRKKLGLKTLK